MADQLNGPFNTTGGSIYLLGERTLERLEIQFVPPKLNLNRKGTIAEIEIVGRNTPQYQYLSGSTEISFDLDFYADDEARQSVVDKCRWLESLLTSERYKQGPERVKLIFGRLFKYEMWTVKSCPIDYSLFDKQNGYLPRQAYAQLTLALDPRNNLTTSDLRNYGIR